MEVADTESKFFQIFNRKDRILNSWIHEDHPHTKTEFFP